MFFTSLFLFEGQNRMKFNRFYERIKEPTN